MTLLTAVRPYHRLSDVLREDVDAALTGFRAYLAMMRPKGTCAKVAPKGDTVSPLPEAPELDMSFLPKTESQKRTRKPRENSDDSAPEPIYGALGGYIMEPEL